MNSTLSRQPMRTRGSTDSSHGPTEPARTAARNAIDQAVPATAHPLDGIAPTHQPDDGNEGRPWRRAAAVVAGAIAFLGIASLIKPDPRTAAANDGGSIAGHPTDLPLSSGAHTARAGAFSRDLAGELALRPHPKGWRVIGSLESTEHLVLVYASPDGPRYSVFTLQGRLISADLPAEDVYRDVPDLDLSTLRDLPASDGKPLMLATPQD